MSAAPKSPRLLLAKRRISDFSTVLSAYAQAGINLGSCIDGGAGFGHTALKMCSYLNENEKVLAFEPFPGNHRFFEKPEFLKAANGQVELVKKAISNEKGQFTLAVSSIVEEGSRWGATGKSGYSSAGRLDDRAPQGQHDCLVECVRLEDEIPQDTKIGFIKLDLQGGELNALKGLGSRLADIPLMWIEFMGQADLYKYLTQKGFILFDSSYLFFGEPNDATRHYFQTENLKANLSIDQKSWTGFRRDHWGDYLANFRAMKTLFGLVQTDLLCINRNFLEEFHAARPFIKKAPRGA